jgi:hypothetical protein
MMSEVPGYDSASSKALTVWESFEPSATWAT